MIAGKELEQPMMAVGLCQQCRRRGTYAEDMALPHSKGVFWAVRMGLTMPQEGCFAEIGGKNGTKFRFLETKREIARARTPVLLFLANKLRVKDLVGYSHGRHE